MQREDGSFVILPLLSFHDVDSSGKPYLVQAYPLRRKSAIRRLYADIDTLYFIQNQAYCLDKLEKMNDRTIYSIVSIIRRSD